MICKHCYEVFCDNTFGKMQLFETEEERKEFFSKMKVMEKDKQLKLVKISRNMSEEEFEEIKRNKQDLFFLVLVRNYIENGFSKIEYL